MMPGTLGRRFAMRTCLLTAAAATLGVHAATSPVPRAIDAVPESLRVVTLEDGSPRGLSPREPAHEVGVTRPMAGRLARGDLAAQGVGSPLTGSLVGRVDIRGSDVTVRRPDVSGLSAPRRSEQPEPRPAVVYLEPPSGAVVPPPEPMRARIDQRDETFMPHVLAITAGSVVDFPNSDRTYHNVFSLSRTRRFDLGRYAQGRSRSVRFDRPGIVRVFCDIHSHMSAYVLVFDHRFFATTDAEGRYRIDRVPPGRHTVTAWHEGGVRDTRTVTLPSSGGPVDLDFSVP